MEDTNWMITADRCGMEPDQASEASTSRPRRSAATGGNRRKRTRLAQVTRRQRIFRTPASRTRKPDATPMMVADFVFRKQIEWLTENTGVRDDFRDVAQKIWFSYLSHYMPDFQNGIQQEVGGSEYWHQAFPRSEQSVLLNCSNLELNAKFEVLRRKKPMKEPGDRKMNRFNKNYRRFHKSTIYANFKKFCPTSALLFAVIMIAMYSCQEEILLSDLLRWARLLKLPLIDLVPYKDSASPAQLHGLRSTSLYGVGLYNEVEKRVSWMASTLLENSLSKVSSLAVAPFVERFIEELNLPFEMVPFVLGTMEKIGMLEHDIKTGSVGRSTTSFRRGRNMESFVMSCVFHALRLLFVLDDITETRVSDLTGQMQELNPDTTLFNFRVWFQHLMHRRIILSKHTVLSRQTHDAEAYLSFAQGNPVPPSLFKLRSADSIRNKGLNQIHNELRQRLGQNFVEPATLFVDLPVTLRPYRAHTEALTEHYPELAIDFSKHTIQHLLTENVHCWNEELGAENILSIHQTRLSGFQKARLIRDFRNRDARRVVVVHEENLPHVVRNLFRIMADMIDQLPALLIGSLVYLELAFFPQYDLQGSFHRARNYKSSKTS